MAYSQAQRKSILTTLSIVAFVAIVLTGLGSAMLATSGLRWEAAGTALSQTGGTVFFLTMVSIFFFLIYSRYRPPVEVRFQDHRGCLWISPIGPDNALIIHPQEDASELVRQWTQLPKHQMLRIVVARENTLDAEFFHGLRAFKSLLGLDIQRSKLEPGALDALSELCDLKWLLVHQAIDEKDALGLEILLPEVSIVYSARKIGLLDQPIESAEPPARFADPIDEDELHEASKID